MTTPLPQLKRMEDGHPALLDNGECIPIHIVPCFPWTHPGRFLSLRDREGVERALVEDPTLLDADSRHLLENERATSNATFVVTRIREITKEIELRCWVVEVEGGERHFQTELDEWPRALPDGSLLMEDLFGDLYRIPNPQSLDSASFQWLQPLLG
jgi:hypothetical protein